jgi:ribosomal protein S18 acetylase RimI-like enzyme
VRPLCVAGPVGSATIERLSAQDAETFQFSLAELLVEAVEEGSSLGFLPPLGLDEAKRYWLSLRDEVQLGTRLLIAARSSDRVVAAAQLALPSWPNAQHRAEVQKVIVAATSRRSRLGSCLMAHVHRVAREEGRTLLLLNAPADSGAERFYRAIGYREAGVVPGYSLGPNNERFDNKLLFYGLSPHSVPGTDPPGCPLRSGVPSGTKVR